MKLGLKPHKPDPRDLPLNNFLAPVSTPSDDFGHGDLVREQEWGMLGNDSWGDCVFAGAAHETLILGREGNHHPTFDEAVVLSDYHDCTGFNYTEATDRGTDMRAAAQYRRKTGILDSAYKGRHRIGAFLWLNKGDVSQLWEALKTFSVAGIGYELPESAERQFHEGRPWDVDGNSRIAGGHYVPAIGRKNGNIDAVSWGRRIEITPAFYERYCMAACVYVSASVLDASGVSPEGLDRQALLNALKSL